MLRVRTTIFLLMAVAGAMVWWWPQTSAHILSFDFAQAWGPDRAVIFGGPGYGPLWRAYPVPILLLFLPLGVLPASAAALAGAAITAVWLRAALMLVDAPERAAGGAARDNTTT